VKDNHYSSNLDDRKLAELAYDVCLEPLNGQATGQRPVSEVRSVDVEVTCKPAR